jgi:hypothetical protein
MGQGGSKCGCLARSDEGTLGDPNRNRERDAIKQELDRMNKRLEDLNAMVLQMQDERDSERWNSGQVLAPGQDQGFMQGSTGGTYLPSPRELPLADSRSAPGRVSSPRAAALVYSKVPDTVDERKTRSLSPTCSQSQASQAVSKSLRFRTRVESESNVSDLMRKTESIHSVRFQVDHDDEFEGADPRDRSSTENSRNRLETFQWSFHKQSTAAPKKKKNGLEDMYAGLGRESARPTNVSEYWCTETGHASCRLTHRIKKESARGSVELMRATVEADMDRQDSLVPSMVDILPSQEDRWMGEASMETAKFGGRASAE